VTSRLRYVSADEDSAHWSGFPFRPGDIVGSTRSMSGTTWMHDLCAPRPGHARPPASHQGGNVEPFTESDVIDRARKTLTEYQAGPFANYMPYTKHTDSIMQRLADLNPRMIAPMHGSAFVGDGSRSLRDLAGVMREVLG